MLQDPIPRLFLSAFGALASSMPLKAQEPEPVAIEIGQRLTLKSKILGEDRPLSISLPSDYKRSKQRYGVVYLLDGPNYFTTAVGAFRHLENSHPAMIIVGIHNTKRTRDLTPKSAAKDANRFGESGGSATFRSFLFEELLPFLGRRFLTSELSLLIGHSFGGLFAVDTMLEQPKAFTGYLALSPSLWWNDEKLVQRMKKLPAKHGLFDRFVYLSMGDEGQTMNPPFERTVWSLKASAPERFRWDVGRFPGEGHWSVVIPSLYAGLQSFFEPIRSATQADGETDVTALASRFANLKHEFGEIKVPVRAFLNVARRLADRKQATKALEAFEATAKRFPNEPMVYDTHGQCLEDLGRHAAAAAVYKAGADRFAGGRQKRASKALKARLEAVRARLNAGNRSRDQQSARRDK